MKKLVSEPRKPRTEIVWNFCKGFKEIVEIFEGLGLENTTTDTIARNNSLRFQDHETGHDYTMNFNSGFASRRYTGAGHHPTLLNPCKYKKNERHDYRYSIPIRLKDPNELAIRTIRAAINYRKMKVRERVFNEQVKTTSTHVLKMANFDVDHFWPYHIRTPIDDTLYRVILSTDGMYTVKYSGNRKDHPYYSFSSYYDFKVVKKCHSLDKAYEAIVEHFQEKVMTEQRKAEEERKKKEEALRKAAQRIASLANTEIVGNPNLEEELLRKEVIRKLQC